MAVRGLERRQPGDARPVDAAVGGIEVEAFFERDSDLRSEEFEAVACQRQVGGGMGRRATVPADDDARPQREHAVARPDPRRDIGIGDERNAAGEHQVADEQLAVFLDQHHQVFGRVRRAGMHDAEGEPTELEHRVVGDEAIGHDDAGQRVDPRRRRLPAFGQADGQRIGREVVGDPRVGQTSTPRFSKACRP